MSIHVLQVSAVIFAFFVDFLLQPQKITLGLTPPPSTKTYAHVWIGGLLRPAVQHMYD